MWFDEVLSTSINCVILQLNWFKDYDGFIFQIKTGIGAVESLDINAELRLQHPGIYQLTVKGDSSMEETKGSSVSTVEIW